MEDITNEINNLLELKSVKEALEKENSFNLFKVCNIEYKELIHSAIIAELLNPKGSHGKGAELLKGFFKHTGIGNEVKFENINNVKVHTEYSIKKGRIDILIEGCDRPIIIENKIWAEDQEHQLLRYYEEFKSHKPILLYLTMYGDSPSVFSLGCKEEDFPTKIYNVSYKNCIRSWLNEIKTDSTTDFSHTLVLYKNTLEGIFEMNNDYKILEEILKPEHYDAFDTIRNLNPKLFVIDKICTELEEYYKNSNIEIKNEGHSFFIEFDENIAYGFDSNLSDECLWPGFKCITKKENYSEIIDGFDKLITAQGAYQYSGKVKEYPQWFCTRKMRDSIVYLYSKEKDNLLNWIKNILDGMRKILEEI